MNRERERGGRASERESVVIDIRGGSFGPAHRPSQLHQPAGGGTSEGVIEGRNSGEEKEHFFAVQMIAQSSAAYRPTFLRCLTLS